MSVLLRILIAFLAIVSGTIGITIVTLRLRAIDPITYQRALGQSGIYREIRINLENLLIEKTAGKEFINSDVAAAVLTPLDLPGLVVETGEKNIDNFFAWANNQKAEIHLYFPRTEIQERFADPELKAKSLPGLETAMARLPECDENHTLTKMLPDCKPVNEIQQQQFSTNLDLFYARLSENSNFVDELMAANGFPDISEDTTIKELLANQSTQDRVANETFFQTINDLISSSSIFGIAGIVISLMLCLGILILCMSSGHWRNLLISFALIYMLTGISTLFIGLILSTNPGVVVNSLPGAFTDPVSLSFNAAVNQFYSKLFAILFQMTIFTGAVLTLINFMLMAIGLLLPATASEKRRIVPVGQNLKLDNELAPKLQYKPFPKQSGNN